MAQRDPAPLPPAGGRGLMLDREREVASLQAALDGLDRGAARTVLVEGRAGIGKSRLLAELRVRAEEARDRVLWARGSELERDFAFGVVRQLFEIAQDPATVLLQPGPLDEEAIGAIVEDRLGTEVDRRFRAASHQALFVTPRTVEVHLSGACRKLGIRSRRELASALAPAA
jgi:hypothetical protein